MASASLKLLQRLSGTYLVVCFISTNHYKNKAIQRRGVEANGAIALQPVEAPGPVYQQTAKCRKENIFTTNQVGVPRSIPEALLHPNSANPTRQTISSFSSCLSY